MRAAGAEVDDLMRDFSLAANNTGYHDDLLGGEVEGFKTLYRFPRLYFEGGGSALSLSTFGRNEKTGERATRYDKQEGP